MKQMLAIGSADRVQSVDSTLSVIEYILLIRNACHLPWPHSAKQKQSDLIFASAMYPNKICKVNRCSARNLQLVQSVGEHLNAPWGLQESQGGQFIKVISLQNLWKVKQHNPKLRISDKRDTAVNIILIYIPSHCKKMFLYL